MTEAKSGALMKSVEDLLAEKQVLGEKERELVQSLNSALRKVGYEVVPIHSAKPAVRLNRRGRPPGRPRKRRGPGRPPKA
ncbi:MAG: hypothetical protein E6K68_10650 [Nitrospirae bacterium]|nr:MAG: hypothetical protein E6K68_10650 [Nitrospirota bacterium]